MGYRRMTHEDLYEIFRRWHDGQSIKHISESEERDRKTVRNYLEQLSFVGFSREEPFPEKHVIMEVIALVLPTNRRMRKVSSELDPHVEELKDLINRKQEPVKPKTAWLIIKEKYELSGSYATFKRFIRERRIARKPVPLTIRIELPPGQETQLDYGKMGTLFDPVTNRNRTVYSFCGILSHSRLPFIQYVFTQKEESFVASHVDMFEFYGGTTVTLNPDNLKSGVITPDLWDPKLNKSYSEMAEHYGVFIDPSRAGKPKDKGKVERSVPLARELFRRLKEIHPAYSIHELNECALKWCRVEYGMKEHGTTGRPPVEIFEQNEQPTLKKLPSERFEIPIGKKAKVHPDQFFSFQKKRYSLPAVYRQKEVWVRKTKNMLRIFFQYKLIREYVIPENSYTYLPRDFPEVVREMMEGGFPKYLLDQSQAFGTNAHRFIESVLHPHANLNSRRAQGILEIMKKYVHTPFFSEVCNSARIKGVRTASTFKWMLEEEAKQLPFEFIGPTSEEGKAMIREATYYFN